MLEITELAYQGTPLGLGGTVRVPCPWCNPRPWFDLPWTDPLMAALDKLP